MPLLPSSYFKNSHDRAVIRRELRSFAPMWAASIPAITLQSGGDLVIVNAQKTPLDPWATLRYSDLREFAAAVLDVWGFPGQFGLKSGICC